MNASLPPYQPESAANLVELLNRVLSVLDEIRSLVKGAQKEYLTVEEVATLTGRSRYTVRRWITEGRLEARRMEGTGPHGRLLVGRAELAKLIDLGLGGHISAVMIECKQSHM